jgi:uncharacterized cupredoxin-like copper-binding protein
MNKTHLAATLALMVLMAGCAVFGISQPQTFEERAAAAYATNAAVRDTAATLLVSGKIDVGDAINIQAQADNARAGIDIARQIYTVDIGSAETRLETAIVILTALDNYLRSKQ